ncbi:MAG: hypothetical protein LW852_06185 [Sediminibacterium sp.]|jgi:hypothetical protein|nr:hypothetical protein [Sediminibacterium sp.]
MKLLEGNGFKFLEVTLALTNRKIYFNTNCILGIEEDTSVAGAEQLYVSLSHGPPFLIKGTLAQFFSTLGCNTFTEPINGELPF